MMHDGSFLEVALENARQSFLNGHFPAGAIVARDGVILSSAINSHPLRHADAQAVTEAFSQHGPLTGATLYIVMEPCLMCTGTAYWAGVRRIVYAVAKSSLPGAYYETPAETKTLLAGFNEPVELVHLDAWAEPALEIVREWENGKA